MVLLLSRLRAYSFHPWTPTATRRSRVVIGFDLKRGQLFQVSIRDHFRSTRTCACLSSEATARSPGSDASSVTPPAQAQTHLKLLGELLAAYCPETSVLLVGYRIGDWCI